MKAVIRVQALIIAAAILFSGCSMAEGIREQGTSVSMYYEYRDVEQLKEIDSVVGAEQRRVEVLSLWDFLDEYLRGPSSDALISPFPAGTGVIDIHLSACRSVITLSGEFFTLVGIELSIAGCCMAKTVCEYTGRDSVILKDETDSIRFEIDPARYVLSNMAENETNESFTVYFPDKDWRYLIPETRDATLSNNDTEAAFVLRKLIEGPENNQLEKVCSEGTELLGISVIDGLCTVNLSAGFLDGMDGTAYRSFLTVYAIVNTLTGLDDIGSVQFLVEGEPVPQYGPLPMESPISRYTECIGPLRTASGEVDVNIYVRTEAERTAFSMPCRVKQTISEPLAEAVVRRALSFEPPAGFYNPIPFGTDLISISVSGGVCYLDLSERFIPAEDTEQAEIEAVWSLVSLLTQLDGISSVVLTIGGERTGLSYVDISEPLYRDRIRTPE